MMKKSKTKLKLMDKIKSVISAREENVGKREIVAKGREDIAGKREQLATGRETLVEKREGIKKGGGREGIALGREKIAGKRENVAKGREEIAGKREQVSTGREKIVGKREAQCDTLFETLVENMPSGIAIYRAVDNGNNFVFAGFNKTAEKIDRISKDKVIGKKITAVFPGVKQFGLLDILKKVWKTGKPEHHADKFYADKRISGWRNNHVFKLPSGEVVAVYEDITEQKKIEDMLIASEKKFKDISMAAPEWIWEVNEKGQYTFSSMKIKELLGYEPEEIIGKTPFDLMPKDEAKKIGVVFGEIAKKKKPFSGLENWNLTKRGKRVLLETNGMPILDEKGNFLGYRGMDRDITEKKKAEQQALEAKDSKMKELERFNQFAVGREMKMIELKKRIKELEDKLNAKK